MQPKFSPIQTRILNLLGDGESHKRMEVLACIGDEQATLNNLSVHICLLRRMMKMIGQDIVCELGNRGICYRMVRHLHFSP